MHELETEYHFWRQVLAKKLLSGELEREGIYALDSKIRRIYRFRREDSHLKERK